MKIEQRPDGLWLIFATGEQAGPFAGMNDAESFLDYVENMRAGLRKVK